MRCAMGTEGVTRRDAMAVVGVAGLAAGVAGLSALSGEAVAAGSEQDERSAKRPMRLFVVTDRNGKVIGTGPAGKIRHEDEKGKEGTVEVRPIPTEGQIV